MPTTVEDQTVTAWHVEQMVLHGMSPDIAIQLAELGVDWHEVADLLADGCPPHLVVRILAPVP